MPFFRAPVVRASLGLLLLPAAAGAQEPAPPPGPLWQQAQPGVRVDSIVPDTRDRAAAATVTELMRGRAAGLAVLESSGVLGASPRLWIRGPGSIILRNDPLVVVDGVRILSDPRALGLEIGGQSTSRLEDLSPHEVRSVRVLRGPAAAALYGPEAAAGVLEVQTHGGARRAGEPRFRAWSSLALRRERTEFPANYARPGVDLVRGIPTESCTLQGEVSELCAPALPHFDRFNPLETYSPFRGGVSAGAGLRISGGAAGGRAAYALDAGTEGSEGVLRNNALDLRHLRGSLALAAGDARLSLTAAHARRETELPFTGGFSLSRIGAGLDGYAYDGPNRGYDSIVSLEDDFYRNTEDVRRTTLGGALEWTALGWLTLGAGAGRDQADADALTTFQQVGGTNPFRREVADERARWQWGAHATARGARGPQLQGSLTAGYERLGSTRSRTETEGTQGGGSARNELQLESQTYAAFARGAVQWRALSLGGAARRDEAAGLGEPGHRVSYSLGGAWSPSWGLGALGMDGVTLRAAHGRTERGLEWRAGLPDPRACTSGCAVPAEALAETEGGVDLRFGGRADLGVTGYTRETTGVVSQVFGGGVAEAGRVTNRGIEVTAALRGPQGGRVEGRLDLSAAANRNRFHATGPVTTVFAGTHTSHRDGHPLGSYFYRRITGFTDAEGDGVLGECVSGLPCEVELTAGEEYAGTPTPSRLGSLAGTVRLARRATLYARVDGQGGARLLDLTSAFRCSVRLNCQANYDPSTPLDEQAVVVAALQAERGGYVRNADFVRLREVALTLEAPAGWVRRFGAAGVELTFAGRNLATRTDYPGLDPEASVAGPGLFTVVDEYELPPVRTFTTRIDVRF